jgi:uncharacterized protein with HEPN domain
MPSEQALKALLDIKDNAVLARSWSEGLSLSEFAEDRMVFYAVTRCLEIISEASRRLPPDVRHRNIPWRDIADAGNIYRHAYDGVQERIVLETVRRSLPELELIVDAEIAGSGAGDGT